LKSIPSSKEKLKIKGSYFPYFRKSKSDATILVDDFSFGQKRKQIQCKNCNQPIGHCFANEEGDERHCLSSGALNLIIDENAKYTIADTKVTENTKADAEVTVEPEKEVVPIKTNKTNLKNWFIGITIGLAIGLTGYFLFWKFFRRTPLHRS